MSIDYDQSVPKAASVLVYSYHSTSPKERRERFTLREWCSALSRQEGSKYTLAARPLDRRLVIDIGGATVDGVVNTPFGYVAVELLSLSPVSDRGDVLVADLALRRQLRARVRHLLIERGWALTLWYKVQTRRDGTDMKAVPRTHIEAGNLVADLKRLLLRSPAPEVDSSVVLHVAAVEPDDASSLQRGNRFYFPATEYPAAYRHLSYVRVYAQPRGQRPDIHSDLKTGFVGADSKFLATKLRDKAERSLGLSAQRANGLPLWLVVHSDGRAIHQSIAPPQRNGAVKLCRGILAKHHHGFQRVYWADWTGFRNTAWVGRVI